jgi:hypothetical protein
MLIRRAKNGPKALFWANFGKFLKHYLLILRVSRIIYSLNYGRNAKGVDAIKTHRWLIPK